MTLDYAVERAAGGRVAGVDEAGRGPLAGPVVAAAVILDPAALPKGINDSKLLSAPRRRALFRVLREGAIIGIGAASTAEIERLNILQATLLAMARAVAALKVAPDLVLVDGNKTPQLRVPVRAIVDGDASCLSIAAASIIAKVTRDRIMDSLAQRYPGFGWERNSGYGTKEHLAALARLGPTAHHRRLFKPVAQYLVDIC